VESVGSVDGVLGFDGELLADALLLSGAGDDVAAGVSVGAALLDVDTVPESEADAELRPPVGETSAVGESEAECVEKDDCEADALLVGGGVWVGAIVADVDALVLTLCVMLPQLEVVEVGDSVAAVVGVARADAVAHRLLVPLPDGLTEGDAEREGRVDVLAD
jgi:hypothetical protein